MTSMYPNVGSYRAREPLTLSANYSDVHTLRCLAEHSSSRRLSWVQTAMSIQLQNASDVFRKYCLRQVGLRGPPAVHAPCSLQTESALMAAASSVKEASAGDQPP